MSNLELNPNGGLKNLSLWTEEVANTLAKRENMTLTSAHWEIIRLMRTYYENYNISPIMKLLKKQIRESLGDPKAEDSYLYNLLPNGVLMQGVRLAG
jgi:tRNA 2-thiouridine synthesizing protein E